MCKLLLCFAQSSYYFRIGFVSGGIKGFVFLDALGFVCEDALCTLHCPRETIVGEAGKAWAGEWVRDQDASPLRRNSGASPGIECNSG